MVQIVAVYSPTAAIAMEQPPAVAVAVGSIEVVGHCVLHVQQMAGYRTECQRAYAAVHLQKARNEARSKNPGMGYVAQPLATAHWYPQPKDLLQRP